MARNAEFSNQEDIQRRPQGLRYFEGDGHAAARQRQYQ